MNYTVSITPAALRALESLPKEIHEFARKIDALSQNPRPAGCVKLTGGANAYRIRIGDFRVIYEIRDDRQLLIVFIVGNRRDVYRGL